MNPTDQTKKKEMQKRVELSIAFAILALVIVVGTGYFLFNKYKVTPGKPPKDITQVGAGMVSGPNVSVTKVGENYVLNGSSPIMISKIQEGINFTNNTTETISIFIPALDDPTNNKKLPSGSVASFSLNSIRKDASTCPSGATCNVFEFLGSTYPGLFKGTFAMESSQTTVATPVPPALPDLTGEIQVSKNASNTYDIRMTIRNTTATQAGTVTTYLYVDPQDAPPIGTTIETSRSSVPSLAGMGDFVWTRTSQTLAPGNHRIYLWIDKANTVNEQTESNNVITFDYTAN